MHWLYGQQDTVFVNSEQYRRSWIDRGIEPDKLKILPRGLDTELFHPTRRDRTFWQRFETQTHAPTKCSLALCRPRFERKRSRCPRRGLSKTARSGRAGAVFTRRSRALRRSYGCRRLPDAVFTGYLSGEDLAAAYASADIFVFPSTTDTFGNVIIEAQAAGLPVVVSDMGGPKELVENGVDGMVTKARDVEDFASAMIALVHRSDLARADERTRA